MQSSMLKAIVEDFGNGGTIDGDVVITGDLQVDGGGSLSFDEIIEGTQVIDVTSTEALLVRKNADGGDVFVVDTTNARVGIGTAPSYELDISASAGNVEARIYRNANIKSSLRFQNSVQHWEIGNSVAVNNEFSIKDITDSRTVLHIDGAGNVGIGTTSPDSALHLSTGKTMTIGTFADVYPLSVYDAVTGGVMIYLRNTTHGANSTINMYAENDSGALKAASIALDPDAETLALGNSNFVVNTTSANVGIGTASPDSHLHISYADTETSLVADWGAVARHGLVIQNTQASAGVYSSLNFRTSSADARIALEYNGTNNGDFHFIMDNTNSPLNAMTITNAGNVGIGNTAPSTLLEIQGGLTTTGAVLTLSTKEPSVVANDVLGRINFQSPLDTGADSDLVGASIAAIAQDTFSDIVNSTALHFQTGKSELATTKMVIDEDGFVGVGTTSPTTPLQSKGGSVADVTDNAGIITNASASFVVNHTNNYGIYTGYINDSNDAIGVVATKTGGAALPLSLQPFGGNVGINESSPDTKLHVSDTGDTPLKLEHTDGTDVHIELRNNAGAAYINSSTNDIVFKTTASATERMRIDSSGNVGIGTASPSTYNNYASNLVVYEAGHAGITIATNSTNHTSIYFADGTSGAEAYAGYIDYNHNGDVFEIGASASAKIKLDANSRISLSNNDAGSYNTTFGYKAGLSIVSGATYNTFIGHEVSDATMTAAADYNTGVGSSALGALTAGAQNTAVGSNALVANTAGNFNVAVGVNTLIANVGTHNNTGIGTYAGQNTIGADNTYVGFSAGKGAAGADTSNVGVGVNALLAITSGTDNTVIGTGAADALLAGIDNVIIGAGAGTATTAVDKTVIIGRAAGQANMTAAADGSIGIGYSALNALTSGANNVAVGYNASKAITTGGGNTSLGESAMVDLVEGTNNTAIGKGAFGGALDATADASTNNVFIGKDSGGGAWVTAVSNFNVAVGNNTMDAAMNGALQNTAVGHSSLSAITTGDWNTSLGSLSLEDLSTGARNTALGFQSGLQLTGATHNTIVGMNAMGNVTADVVGVTAIGYNAVPASGLTTGANYTVGIGYSALAALTSGAGNVAVGKSTLSVCTTGKYNTALGHQALSSVMDVGDSNTAVGYQSLYECNPDTDDHGSNTAVGKQSGYDITTGTGNTLVGSNTGNSGSNDLTTGDNNTFIGNEANGSAVGATNQTVIGATTTGVADNSVTLGNAAVTAVYMAQDSGATVYCAGVNFPDTFANSTDANTLDDYEEGTFTASLTSASAPTSVPTATCNYTKIGNVVNVFIRFTNVDTSGGSGDMIITGLPFTSKNIVDASISVPMTHQLSIPNAYVSSIVSGDTTAINFLSPTDNGSWGAVAITAGTGKYLSLSQTYLSA